MYFTPLRVLIVDDYQDQADSLRTLLRYWGHDAQAAYDGAVALQITQWFRPHVVLINLAMPGMDGFELARQIQQHVGAESPFLIAISGYGSEAITSRVHAAGFIDCLVKPIDLWLLKKYLSTEDLSVVALEKWGVDDWKKQTGGRHTE